MKIFTNSLEGIFLRRPNRFIIFAETREGEIRAHCPNPGRLTEILVPGRRVILEKSTDPKRKTPYTLAAAYYKGKVIPLYSSKANQTARELVLPGLFPEAKTIQAEQKAGHSRFDFKVTLADKEVYVEVKACTLVEYGVAMFPDAPTKRGQRHLLELAELTKEKGISGAVIFIINHEDAEVFIPSLHTDPLFAQTLEDVASKIKIHCVSVKVSPDGEVEIVNPKIPINLNSVKFCREDRGCYILLIKLETNMTIPSGSLGDVTFKAGFFLYIGSGKKNLSGIVNRHLRKRKNIQRRVDYLIQAAEWVKGFPVYTDKDLECSIAQQISRLASEKIPHFGTSACDCGSHLFYFPKNPFSAQDFLNFFFKLRHKTFYSLEASSISSAASIMDL